MIIFSCSLVFSYSLVFSHSHGSLISVWLFSLILMVLLFSCFLLFSMTWFSYFCMIIFSYSHGSLIFRHTTMQLLWLRRQVTREVKDLKSWNGRIVMMLPWWWTYPWCYYDVEPPELQNLAGKPMTVTFCHFGLFRPLVKTVKTMAQHLDDMDPEPLHDDGTSMMLRINTIVASKRLVYSLD